MLSLKYDKVGDDMVRKFRYKHNQKKIFKYLLFILIIYLIYSVISFLMLNIRLFDNNEALVTNIISSSSCFFKSNRKEINLLKLVTRLDFDNPENILKDKFGYNFNNDESTFVYNDNYNSSIAEAAKFITKSKVDDNPQVYIYNTHQTEEYSDESMNIYNITPNVLMVSYLLKEKLDKLGLSTLVEESNVSELLRINNWKYTDSYKASRFYVLDAINKYPSIKLFIDIHRDSINKSNSTVNIDGKSYAKVLFVVGAEHSDYEKNLNLTNYINDKIDMEYPSLSRGVLKKSGVGVNGVYNQDLNENIILLEIGGNENNITEVLNTVEAMSNIIKEYINDKRD